MTDYSQHDPWLDNASLDSLLAMSSPFNFGSPNGLTASPEEPSDFIQKLANQSQVLACLRWLGEFQILALIPLQSSISAIEVAELACVPALDLSRVCRMTATAGFLCEPHVGHISHTALSARFVTDLSFFDAIMFLAENAAPTALQMATATERRGRRKDSTESAYSVAFNTTRPFQSACQDEPRLQRRYNAYMRYALSRVRGFSAISSASWPLNWYTAATSNGFIELLSRLNWRGLGKACVVDANAQSADVTLAICQWNTSLRVVLQTHAASGLENPDGRFIIQERASAATQPIKDATVYILRIRDASTLQNQLVPELHAHLQILRGNGSATLIVEVPFVPEPGSVDPSVEASARLWDLSRSQFMNEGDLKIEDLESVINNVNDGNGKLVVVNKLRSRSSTTLAIGIKYEPGLSGLYSSTPLLG